MAAQRETVSSVRAAAPPYETIASIADELDARAFAFERMRDPRCVFARAYATLSRELSRQVVHVGFADTGWVTQLALVFSGYYLRALRERDAGTLPSGAWRTVFDAGAAGETSVLEDLVLGMTAHIVHDLPLALVDVGLTAPNGQSRIGDYHLLNNVLASAVEGIQADVARRYDPWLRVLDQLVENYDEIVTNYGLRIGRATAWYNAQRLLDPASSAAARAAITRSPEITLREILDPPVSSLRLVARGFRILARKGRRWPRASRRMRTRGPRNGLAAFVQHP